MNKQFLKLTDPQWEAISPFFNLKRKRKLDLREVMNALLFIVRTGCQWRNLPSTWPNWQAVYYYFDKGKTNGLLEKINLALNKLDRRLQGREEWPSVLCIDSQSVKLSPMIFENRGTDANKKLMAGNDNCWLIVAVVYGSLIHMLLIWGTDLLVFSWQRIFYVLMNDLKKSMETRHTMEFLLIK